MLHSSEEKEPIQGITGISVSGFKSLYQDCTIEVRPLTILAGANSSGKSSIMQPLLLMKQTLEATYDPGALLLYGPNVRFTSATQLFSQVTDKFSIQIQINHNKLLKNTFSNSQTIFEVLETEIQDRSKSIKFSIDSTRQEIINSLANFYSGQWKTILEDPNSLTYQEFEWNVFRVRCFLHLECNSEIGIKVGKEMTTASPVTLYESMSHTKIFNEQIQQLIHVPGIRGNPERAYKVTGIGPAFPGTFDNYVASIIHHWQETEDQRLLELGTALETLGLTWKIESQKINDVQIDLRVGRLPQKSQLEDVVSIADVGFGVSQVLPVLVALLVAEPEQLVYLEQPELHLHPRAQANLAQLLIKAANRGVRVVLETHSDLLLRRIQSLVAEGQISPKIVKLHWFKRNYNGATEISSADLDEAGAFGDWPEDFSEVALTEESRYLDAAESHLAQHSYEP